jgi:integrase
MVDITAQKKTRVTILSKEQFSLIRKLGLDKAVAQMKARDLLIFACSTGLRYDEYLSILPESIKGDYLTINEVTRKEKRQIPLNRIAKAIVKKYGMRLPRFTSDELNRHLNVVGIQADLHGSEAPRYDREGNPIVHYCPLYIIVSTNLVRRTFIALTSQNVFTDDPVKEKSQLDLF